MTRMVLLFLALLLLLLFLIVAALLPRRIGSAMRPTGVVSHSCFLALRSAWSLPACTLNED